MKKPTTRDTGQFYRPDIDGLRAVAVASVVIYHAFPETLPGGFLGVDVFFVISGYLITRILADELEQGSFSLKTFYFRRARRILPALVLVLVSCALFGWFSLTADELNQLGKHIFAGVVFVSNLVLWSETGYFDIGAEFKPLMHLWSLGVEEQFYLFWPLALGFFFFRRIHVSGAIFLILLTSFCLNVALTLYFPTAAFFSPFTRTWQLMVGAGLAWVTHGRPDASSGRWFGPSLNALLRSATGRGWLSWVGLTMIVFSVFSLDQGRMLPGFWALLPVGGTFLVILAGHQSWLNRVFLSTRPMVWLGLISYPLYLWHWPIISFGHITHMGAPHRDFMISAILLSLLLAWLTYRLVERRFRPEVSFRSPKMRSILISMCALGVLGSWLSRGEFAASHNFVTLSIPREGGEHAVGGFISWYEGSNGWLFLGNRHDNTVAELRLAQPPTESDVTLLFHEFQTVTQAARAWGTDVALLIAPNKTSIYPQFLPQEITPSEDRYIDYFLDALHEIEGLTVYDPTSDIIRRSEDLGLLYWRTDTHWNYQGAYVAYSGLMRHLELESLEVDFVPGDAHRGDLIDISGLSDYPIQGGDEWVRVYPIEPRVDVAREHFGEQDAFGPRETITNAQPLTDQYVWVLGDSFSLILRDYLNGTFAEVEYVGHWDGGLATLPSRLADVERKPDLIIIIRVERSF